jgi:TRAP-type transport system small permease protein
MMLMLWSNRAERALEYVCAALFLVIVGVVFVNVIGRYFFSAPIRGSDEVAQYLFLWLAYLGAVTALVRGRHYSVSNLVDLLPARLRSLSGVLVEAVVLAILCVLVWYGMRLVNLLGFGTSPALGLPISYIYAALPTASAMMAIAAIARLVWHAVALVRGGAAR